MSPVQERRVPASLADAIPGVRLFQVGSCAVLVSRDVLETASGIVTGDARWHLSISHPRRNPMWDEIGDARDALVPADVVMCVPFPPRAWWLSIHPHCFHLWEIKDPTLVGQWRGDGQQAATMGYGRPSRDDSRQPESEIPGPHGEPRT